MHWCRKDNALDLGINGRDTQQHTDMRNNYRVELTLLVNVFSTQQLCVKYPDRFWGFNSPSTHGTLSSMKNRDMDQKAHTSQSMTEKSLAFSCHSLNANVSNLLTHI